MANSVSNILLHPFERRTLEEKIALKHLGRPMPSLNIAQSSQSHKKLYTRSFQAKYYTDYDWLCGCSVKNAVFCFPCLLFGGDDSWTREGITDLQHMLHKIKTHHCSKRHINNVISLAIVGRENIVTQLSSGYRENIQLHNKKVDTNRYILSKVIDCIRFCSVFELALRSHDETATSDNPGIFLGPIDFVIDLDPAVKVYIESATVFKGTSKTVQNELLDCMLSVCHEHITAEISNAKYVAVMANETSDVSETVQMVLVYRYELNGEAIERFWGFVEPEGQNAEAISTNILQHLDTLLENKSDKLIAQSYDGGTVLSGAQGGVNVKIKERYQLAHFIHCYAHQLNLIMQRAASLNNSARVFFCHLSSIGAFFARTPQRLSILDACAAKKFPDVVPTRWNFQICLVNVVFEHRFDLLNCFEKMKNGECDCNSKTISEAYGLFKLLRDSEFLFWLTFFHRLLPHVDVLSNQLQARQTDSVKVKPALAKFDASVAKVRENIDTIQCEVNSYFEVISKKPQRNDGKGEDDRLAVYAREVCDIILDEARDRFAFTEHLTAARLLDPHCCIKHSVSFPEEELDATCEAYPMLQKSRLRTELEVLYESEYFHAVDGAISLLRLFVNNNVQSTFAQTTELLKIVITTPMPTAEEERCFSALKRIKTFLRNTMLEDRLSALAMLSVEKKMVAKIADFNKKVIEKFANEENRRMDFNYKSL